MEQSNTLFPLLCGINIECEDPVAGKGAVLGASFLTAPLCQDAAVPTNRRITGTSLLLLWWWLACIWVLGVFEEVLHHVQGRWTERRQDANVPQLERGSFI